MKKKITAMFLATAVAIGSFSSYESGMKMTYATTNTKTQATSTTKGAVAKSTATAAESLEKDKINNVTGIKNETIIYNFFHKEMGLNVAITCGILANLEYESLFNPAAFNPSDTGGTSSFGICQWNSGKGAGYRLSKFLNYCKVHRLNNKSLMVQLKYIRMELNTVPYYRFSKLKELPNTKEGALEAAKIWEKFFEGCSSVYYARREKRAINSYWPYYSVIDGENPQGEIEKVVAENGTIYVSGTVSDKDDETKALDVNIYVDGKKIKKVKANPDFEACVKVTNAKHTVKVEAVNIGTGKDAFIGGAKTVNAAVKKSKPIIENIRVKKDSTGYTVSCDVNDNTGIKFVACPTWTQRNGQDDLDYPWIDSKLYRATIKNGKATFRVNIEDHNNEFGVYFTQVYAYDYFGNYALIDLDEELKVELPNVRLGHINGNIKARWNVIEGADLYRVFKCINGKVTKVADIKAGTGSMMSYIITGVKKNQRCGVLVLARVNGTWSSKTMEDYVYM